MPRIYISYPRRDALLAEAAGLIASRLARESVDVDAATAPDDALVARDPADLRRIVQDTALLMVLIGPASVEPSPAMRIELGGALEKRLPIMPVLVNGAQMPSSPAWSSLGNFQTTSLDLGADRSDQIDRVARIALILVRRAPSPAPDPHAGAAPAPLRRALAVAELDDLRQLAAANPTALPASVASRGERGTAGVAVAMAGFAEAPPRYAKAAIAASGAPPVPTSPQPAEVPTLSKGPRKKRLGLLLSSAAVLLLGGSSTYFLLNLAEVEHRPTAAPTTSPAYQPRPSPAPTRPPPPQRQPFASSQDPERVPSTRLNWLAPKRPEPSAPAGPLLAPLFAMAAAPAPPPAPSAPTEVVDVSAFAPNEAPAGDEVLVQVYLHPPRQLARVERSAAKKDPDAQHRETATLATEIERGRKIGIELACPALRIAEPRQELTWNGEPAVCSFLVGLPPEAAGRRHILSVRVLIEDMPIGRLAFALRVTGPEAAIDASLRIQGLDAKRYRYAFLSYHSADRVEVLKNARLLRALGIDVFQDLLSLAAGQQFEPELFAAIDKCDLFLLFWSKTAAASDWVIRETEHALERRATGDHEEPEIKPIILEGPPVPLPPPSLGHLHFNDFITHVIAGIESAQRR